MSAINQERVTGARAMLDCLKEARLIIQAKPFESTTEGYYRRLDQAFDQIMSTVGPLSPKAAGAVGTIIDMVLDGIVNGCSIGGQIDANFVPESALTDEEIIRERQEFADLCDHEETPNRNVIQFPQAHAQ